MKRQFSILCCLATLTMTSAIAEEPPSPGIKWHTDFEIAKRESKKTGKPILIEFSGSDWCLPCIRLEKQVLKQEPFITFAQKNLVLVYCDLPYRKKISKELKAHNKALAEQYQAEIYPVVVLVDATGKTIHRVDGYYGDPGDTYVGKLRKALRKHREKSSE